MDRKNKLCSCPRLPGCMPFSDAGNGWKIDRGGQSFQWEKDLKVVACALARVGSVKDIWINSSVRGFLEFELFLIVHCSSDDQFGGDILLVLVLVQVHDSTENFFKANKFISSVFIRH